MKIIFIILTLIINTDCAKPEKKFLIGFVNPTLEEKNGAPGFLRNMPKFGFIEGKKATYIKCENKDKNEIEKGINR